MKPYITFRDTDKNGKLQYYILQRDFPHYVGCISSHPVNNTIIQSEIPGYHLWVVFAGTLAGNFIPSYQSEKKNIESIFTSMAVWFHTERILTEPKKFKKWQFNPQLIG